MGNKISCTNCNGKPASVVAAAHQSSSSTTTGTAINPVTGANASRYSSHHYHPGGSGAAATAAAGAQVSNILTGRSNHILRLWAEVFHVSASSGAVRWNQVSDDLVPVTVSFINGRYHITAFNSRVEKVLDCWLQSTKLGQASSCFIYWKDNVSGDTWGLNFTSPTDARAFRECIQSGTVQLQTGGPKRAESSYSLRGGDQQQQQQQQTTERVQSKAGSGAHLTTKYYSNRTAISQPNSPSKKRIQQQQQQQHHQMQLQHHPTTDMASNYGQPQQQQQPQCTCDCLTAEMLHKQRNGRIRYANFTRQDSGGTTQSSRSDGSLVRRQHERQQQYYRAHQRSMDEHYRNRVQATTTASTGSRTLGPTSHRRVQPVTNVGQQQQQQQQRMQMTSSGHPTAAAGENYQHPTTTTATVNMTGQATGQNGGYIQIQHQKAQVHASGKQLQDLQGPQQQQQQQQDPQQYLQQQQQQQQPQQKMSRPQSQAQAVQTQQLVSTATTTDDLLDQQQSSQSQPKRSSQRPKSLLSQAMSSMDMIGTDKCRDRTHRSMEGRRRSLERMQCVDLTDASPTTPFRGVDGRGGGDHHPDDNRPSAAQLEEYERELRRRLLHGGDSGQNDSALETFETLLKESMDDVANLMREVQHELTLIRAEERRYQSQSTQSLHRISSAGSSANYPDRDGPIGGLLGGDRRQLSRSPMFDTMSIDGQLPFLPSFASSLANASSAYHNHSYQTWDHRLAAGYLTSSEQSDDERASLTTAMSDDEDNLLMNMASGSGGSSGAINKTLNIRSQRAAINFECLGSVRKTGFLSVKKWLIRKRHTLELARKRGWKGYWVCLKGTTLLFYSCDANMANPTTTTASNPPQQQPSTTGSLQDLTATGQPQSKSGSTSSTSELTPKHLIFVDACLVQPVPEHPRRDNVFCLSTSFGDAYLFDATSLPERDQWIQVIHTACAAQIARNSGRCTISHFLVEEIQRLEAIVEEDVQSRQEAELLLTCCTDEQQRKQLVNHCLMLDEKIENNRIEIFRLRSYLAALTNEEGPNPKTLLSQVSRRTKAQLNRIGVFTVSSLHALNCAKNPQPLENPLQRQNSFSSTGGVAGGSSHQLIEPDPIRVDLYSPNAVNPVDMVVGNAAQSPSSLTSTIPTAVRCTVNVVLMTGEQRTIEVPVTWTSETLLEDIYGSGPESREYFLRCSETGTILYRNDLISNYANHTLLVTPKLLFTVDLVRESNEILFGFSVESELFIDNLRVFVMRVEPNSIAAMHGLCRHDEIMVINGALVQELDMMFVESILQEELTLCLMIRSSRLEVPTQGQAIIKPSSDSAGPGQYQHQQTTMFTTGVGHPTATCTSVHNNISGGTSGLGTSFENEKTSSVTDELIESLVCPPPPSTDFSQLILSDTQLSKYIVPKVDHFLPSSENLTTMNVIDGMAAAGVAAADSSSPSSPPPMVAVNFDDDDVGIGGAADYLLAHTTHDDRHRQLIEAQDNQQQPQQSTYSVVPRSATPSSSSHDVGIDVRETTTNLVDEIMDTIGAGGGHAMNLVTFPPPPPPPLNGGSAGTPMLKTTSTIILTSSSTTSSSAQQAQTLAQQNINNNTGQIKHMEKLLKELLDTETNFCQSLQQLVQLYLEPLSKNNFLTATDIKVLFGSILKVIGAQNEFRSELTEVGEHILGDCQLLMERLTNMDPTTNPTSYPNVNDLGVGYIADCFAKHSKNFRDYSTFCASHARAVKLMAQEKTAVHEWLQKQSNGQISQSLESYLIRPIQRVLKYPLLLGQMKALCNKGTTNYNKLEDAIKDLEKVAEHINEMQRIQEEYGAIFEHLARNHTRLTDGRSPNGPQQNGIVDLSPPALKHYGNVDWINSMEFLGKNCRKGVEWSSICFVFSQCVVFLCKETIRQRKRMPTAKSIDVEIIRHQVLIPVIEVQVRACPQNDPQMNENDYKWDLIQLKMNAGKRSEKIYRLSNKTPEERNEFLRVIRQIIREDVRRMHVNVQGISSGGGVGSGSQMAPRSSKSSVKTICGGSGSGGGGGGGAAETKRSKLLQMNQSAAAGKNQRFSKQPPTIIAPGTTTTRTAAMSKSTGPQQSQPQPYHRDDHQQQQQHQSHHHHHHHHEDNVHKVPCGLCGKEVALGHQRQPKDQQQQQPTTSSSRQDSSSTTSK